MENAMSEASSLFLHTCQQFLLAVFLPCWGRQRWPEGSAEHYQKWKCYVSDLFENTLNKINIFGLGNLCLVICNCLYVIIATFVLTSIYFMVLELGFHDLYILLQHSLKDYKEGYSQNCSILHKPVTFCERI